MAKNLGLMAKIGGGFLATLVSLVGIDAAQALDFNFSWDSSINSTGTTPNFLDGNPGTATGSFSLNGKSAGETFDGNDLSNISITISDGLNDFTRTSSQGFLSNFVEGQILGDGSSIAFTDFALTWNDGTSKGFACVFDGGGACGGANPRIQLTTPTAHQTSYSTPNAALASISATAVTSTPVPFEINPNLGILILMGLWSTKTLIERKKHSKSINS